MGVHRRGSSRRAPQIALVASIGWVAACILPDVDLEGRACPCADGYSCDEATSTCVKGDAAASSTAAATTAAATTGGATTGGATTSGQTQAATTTGAGGDGGEGPVTSAVSSSGGPGGEGGAGPVTVATTAGVGGAGGEGGQGGEGGCTGDQTLGVPTCTDVVEGFDDKTAFHATWTFTGGESAFVVANSELTATFGSSTVVAYTPTTFDVVECGVWVRLVTAPDVDGVMGRLSVGPVAGVSRFNIGVIDDTLQVRDGNTVLSAATYDPATMRYVRIRESGGTLFFATSVDALCWDEIHEVVDSALAVNGRLSVYDAGGTGPTSVVFDDFNLVP